MDIADFIYMYVVGRLKECSYSNCFELIRIHSVHTLVNPSSATDGVISMYNVV